MRTIKKYQVQVRDVTSRHEHDWDVYGGTTHDTREDAEYIAGELTKDNFRRKRVHGEVRIVDVDVKDFSDEPGYCAACGGRCGWLPPIGHPLAEPQGKGATT